MPRNEKSISFDKLRKMTEDSSSVIHFIGIGGVSMYSLARLVLTRGARVTGSDVLENGRIRDLASMGVHITVGHSASNVVGATLVVYSQAISEGNPELAAAREYGIPSISRAQLLGSLMIGFKNRIGISGTHGKSTVTAMLDLILCTTYKPTTLCGADLPNNSPLRIGESDYLVYEACEYKDSFLSFSPTVAVALNLELDHTDYFHGVKQMRESYLKSLSRASELAILNFDDENLRAIIPKIKKRVITFGNSVGCDYRYRIVSFKSSGFVFTLERNKEEIGRFEINIPGVFNVTNAAAAAVTALELGLEPGAIAFALASYRGIPRRLERIGEHLGRQVFYDYAHHPTEIRAGINALKHLTHEPITVIFKPHTFSRTKALWGDFLLSLSLADHVIVTDVYPAREEPIEGISSVRLARELGAKATYSPDERVSAFVDTTTEGAIVIMGAGDLDIVRKSLIM